jgi:hypothetical protein
VLHRDGNVEVLRLFLVCAVLHLPHPLLSAFAFCSCTQAKNPSLVWAVNQLDHSTAWHYSAAKWVACSPVHPAALHNQCCSPPRVLQWP